MEPWQSWAVVLAGGGLAYLYYASSQRKANVASSRPAPIVEQFQGVQGKAVKDKVRRKLDAATTSGASSSDVPAPAPARSENKAVPGAGTGAEKSKKRKAGKQPTATLASAPAPTPAPAVVVDNNAADEEHEDTDDKAWAQQLASKKKGVTLAPPSRTESRTKTSKQSASSGAFPAPSSASSTGGADGDDDLSPAPSPSLNAGDVSDMLEAKTSGPSVLRLTDPAKPIQVRQARPTKDFELQESKKQRQNRKKVEERRIEREADERQRQAKLETQRRTAREARGEPAKNGLGVSKPPSSSAWAASTAARATGGAVSALASDAPLLDTFDRDAEPTASYNGAPHSSTTATSTNTNWAAEEDQGNLATRLSEDDSGWATVPKGKKQKKAGVSAESESVNGSEGVATPIVPVAKQVVKEPVSRFASSAVNGFASLRSGPLIETGSHPEDSQWTA